jgi:hypothetical protein
MCMGYIINLIAQQVLFGSDIDAFEEELTNVITEEIELRNWRKRGLIGKLHNLIWYIGYLTKRRDLLKSIQILQHTSLQNSRDSS